MWRWEGGLEAPPSTQRALVPVTPSVTIMGHRSFHGRSKIPYNTYRRAVNLFFSFIFRYLIRASLTRYPFMMYIRYVRSPIRRYTTDRMTILTYQPLPKQPAQPVTCSRRLGSAYSTCRAYVRALGSPVSLSDSEEEGRYCPRRYVCRASSWGKRKRSENSVNLPANGTNRAHVQYV